MIVIIRKLKFNCTEISKYTDSHEIYEKGKKKFKNFVFYKRDNYGEKLLGGGWITL